jgi:hypothetical protein
MTFLNSYRPIFGFFDFQNFSFFKKIFIADQAQILSNLKFKDLGDRF